MPVSDLPTALAGLREVIAAATQKRWEYGGPNPDHSVIFCVDPGRGYPEPEPPVYEPIALDLTKADAAYIARFDPPTTALLVAVVEAAQRWRTAKRGAEMVVAQHELSDALDALAQHLTRGDSDG